MSDARRYAVWPEPRSRSRSLKGSRPSVPHGANFSKCLRSTCVVYTYFKFLSFVNVNIHHIGIITRGGFLCIFPGNVQMLAVGPGLYSIAMSPPPECASGCVVECRICNRKVAGSNLDPGLLRTKVYSAFHPSGVGK